MGELNFQLNGLCSFETRDEKIQKRRNLISEFTQYIDDTADSNKVQEESIFTILKMINVRGGCIPDYTTTASQTEMSVPVFLPYIFTEVAGTRLIHGVTSQMARLCNMNRNAAIINPDLDDEKKFKKGYKAPIKFNRATTIKETLALFNDILIAKLADDE